MGKILNSYPDYAKATPGYTASMIEAFAGYSVEVQDALADLRTGLRARCAFLPTIADVVKIAAEVQREQARLADLDHRYGSFRREPHKPYQGKASPFPQLDRAFANEPELLDRPFETLAEACKQLVTTGHESAHTHLTATRRPER